MMKAKAQVVFDIKTEKFKYLNIQKQSFKKKVDIEVLNARLNRTRKLGMIANLKTIILCSFCLTIVAIITLYL